MAAELGECVLAFRVEQESADIGASIGLVIRVGSGVIYSKPARMLRIRRALQALWLQGKASGRVMQKFNGHLEYSFLVSRPAFSILEAYYRFAREHDGEAADFGEEVRAEIRVAVFLPFLVHDCKCELCDVAYCSDSSLKGFALHYTAISVSEIRDAV